MRIVITAPTWREIQRVMQSIADSLPGTSLVRGVHRFILRTGNLTLVGMPESAARNETGVVLTVRVTPKPKAGANGAQ